MTMLSKMRRSEMKAAITMDREQQWRVAVGWSKVDFSHILMRNDGYGKCIIGFITGTTSTSSRPARADRCANKRTQYDFRRLRSSGDCSEARQTTWQERTKEAQNHDPSRVKRSCSRASREMGSCEWPGGIE